MREGFLGEGIKKLGFGMMRLPMLDDKVDLEQTKKMVDLYMEKGFTYFDTAYPYLDGQSEKAVKEVLTSRYKREEFLLATKLTVWLLKEKEDMQKIFDEQLERTGAGYFDFYLLHAMNREKADKFERLGAWEFLKKQKEKGLIKHYGFSFHDSAQFLEELLKKHQDVEFVQLQINYCDWDDSMVQGRACYEIARKYNKPVIVMEPVKGGTLASLTPELDRVFKKANPDRSVASWAVRYAASLEGVMTVLSGMSNMEQMMDNLSYMEDFQKLTMEEQAVIDAVLAKLKSIPQIPCTACRYCVEVCPKQIPIPDVFRMYNKNAMFPDSKTTQSGYREIMGDLKCIQCRGCEMQCPQHIKIVEELERVCSFPL